MEEWQINIISDNREPCANYYLFNNRIIDFCIGPVESGEETGHLHFHTYVKTDIKADSMRKSLKALYPGSRIVHVLKQVHTYKENISYILKTDKERADVITNMDSDIFNTIPQWITQDKPDTSRKRQKDFKAYIEANEEDLKLEYKNLIKESKYKKFPSRYDFYAFSYFATLGVPFDKYQVKKYSNLLTVQRERFNFSFLEIMEYN